MKKKKKVLSTAQRTVKGFIRDEHGFVSKNNILKIGLGTVVSMGIMGSLSKAYGARIYFPNPNSLWTRTNMGNIHQNGLGLTPVSGTNCQRLTHVNANRHLSHVSTDVNGYGRGCLSGKGCANFDHNGPANGTPTRPSY